MSKWLDVARAASPELFDGAAPSTGRNEGAVPCANSANSAVSTLLALMAQTAHGTEGLETGNQTNSAPVLCIFCGNPVDIGTPGTGALAGELLHMGCYRTRHTQLGFGGMRTRVWQK